ncbi:RecQ family ATP-dependent DNA helicase [Mesonia aestuariivivens]|uniref:RecQ family ATP-dependent DNA helicase n=1 Tax=Mesonia aestuariivivens TaxID=2796128 RepID=UPI0034E2242A
MLYQYWGYSKFRPSQEEVINHILNNKDVIALMPTGGGKSLCFQVPALLKKGICIVISPLLALMQDQVNNLMQRGIPALMLQGGISYDELDKTLDNCIYGKYKFLYLSPERLSQELVQERIKLMNVSYLVVDEAHCISEWGHDFRPAYQNIVDFKNLHPQIKTIALTATATQKVVSDMVNYLEIPEAKIVKQSFKRHNLSLISEKFEDKNHKLFQFLSNNPGSSIIYVRNRNATEEISEFLSTRNIAASPFHGGLQTATKNKLLKNWLDEKVSVMVATSAFGMGIDKANVRNVIHYHLPESLESFFQEIGRGGRDGKPAKAYLIYNDADILRLKTQFLSIIPKVEDVKLIYKKLNAFFSIAYGEGKEELYNFNFLNFCKTYQLSSGKTYQVLQLLDRTSIFSLKKEYKQKIEIVFKVSAKQVDQLTQLQPKFHHFVQILTRNYSGIFEQFISLDFKELQYKTGFNPQEIKTVLNELDHLEVINLRIIDQDTSIFFLQPREDQITISPLIPYIKQQYTNKETKINAVLAYLENNKDCKMVQLLTYFGEIDVKPCGQCSVCLQKNKNNNINKRQIALEILKYLTNHAMSSREIVQVVKYDEEIVISILQQLLEFNKITLTPDKKYKLK